jgi:hypothetical protein
MKGTGIAGRYRQLHFACYTYMTTSKNRTVLAAHDSSRRSVMVSLFRLCVCCCLSNGVDIRLLLNIELALVIGTLWRSYVYTDHNSQ